MAARSQLIWLLPLGATVGAFVAAGSIHQEQDQAVRELQRVTQAHVESVVRLVHASTVIAMRAHAEGREALEDRLLSESEGLVECGKGCLEAADPWLVVRLAGRPGALEGVWGTDAEPARARLRAVAAGDEEWVDVTIGTQALVCLVRGEEARRGLFCASRARLDEQRRAEGPGATLRDVERDEILYVALQDEGGILAASPSGRTLDGLDAFLAQALSTGTLQYRERRFHERNLLEGASAVPLPDGTRAVLRVGVDASPLLEARARRERRRAALFAVPGLLGVLAFGATWAIDRRRRMRVQLGELRAQHARKEERWAELGSMAAMTAHEVRNPLSTVRMAAQRITIEHEDAGASELARVIVEEVDRLDRVLGDFVALSRPLSIEPQWVRLEQVVAAVAPLRVRAEAEGKHLSIELAPLEVRVDPARLGQALRNLVENALDAVGPSGTVRLVGAAKGPGLELEVLDDGPGLDEAGRAAALELFHTTKSFGTGLGLPIARRIVEGHGGEMSLESPAGGGLRVRLVLPVGVKRA